VQQRHAAHNEESSTIHQSQRAENADELGDSHMDIPRSSADGHRCGNEKRAPSHSDKGAGKRAYRAQPLDVGSHPPSGPIYSVVRSNLAEPPARGTPCLTAGRCRTKSWRGSWARTLLLEQSLQGTVWRSLPCGLGVAVRELNKGCAVTEPLTVSLMRPPA
jgi:hypothetical protein